VICPIKFLIKCYS